MEVTLDLLVDDWLKDNQVLKDHFKVFKYSECENPTSWPTVHDNYVGMICDFGELAFVVMDDHVYRHDTFYNKSGELRVETKIYAADPDFFKLLAYHLALKHQRRHGPKKCKLYESTEGNYSNPILFDA